MQFWQGLRRDYPAAVWALVLFAGIIIGLSVRLHYERTEADKKMQMLQEKAEISQKKKELFDRYFQGKAALVDRENEWFQIGVVRPLWGSHTNNFLIEITEYDVISATPKTVWHGRVGRVRP